MGHDSNSAFHRIARVVTLRDLQRQFAFVWDVELRGNSERGLLEHYVSTYGALSRAPVLLTADYSASESAPGHEGSDLPWGVYYPEKAIAEFLLDGKLDWDLLEDDNEGGSLDDGICGRTIEITPKSFVSADTTLLEFLSEPPPEFAGRGAVVLDRNRWTGVFTRDELMSAPARMCLFALILELEERASDLCRLFPTECVKSLPPGRRESAINTMRHRLGQKQMDASSLSRHLARIGVLSGGKWSEAEQAAAVASWIIDSTNLTDKSRMICKCKLIIEPTNTKVKSVFARADRLRNRCAHPGLESERLPLPFADLVKLVNDAGELIRIFSDSFEVEARARKILADADKPPSGS